MTFDASKPDSNESPDQFPAQCQTNWSRLKTQIAVDHIFTDASTTDEGKHNQVTLPEQSSAPSTAANELAAYTKETASISELFVRREGDGTEIQMTSGAVTDTTAQATNGYSCLPGGVLIQWGKKTSPGSSGTITFPKAFGAAPYCIQVSLQRTSGNQSVTVDNATIPTTTQFKYLSSSAGSNFMYWIAIGTA